MRIVSMLVIPASLLFAAGCSTPYYDTSYGTYPPSPGATLTAGELDRALEASVHSQLNRYGDLTADCSNVQVHSIDGNVTLTGTVPNERDRQMVETVARNTAGVVAVNDQIQVAYPPTGAYIGPTTVYSSAAPVESPNPVTIAPSPAPVYTVGPNLTVQATADADRAIAQSISDQLRPEPEMNSLTSGARIIISHGRVYLRGNVGSEAQRAAMISAVRNTPGVVAVYDELKVR